MPMSIRKISLFFKSLGKLIASIRAAIRRGPQPICTECSCAHVQYAASGEQKVFCTFGGGVRPVEINVVFCTDFRDRSVPARSNVIAGFIGPVRGIETALPETARHES